MTFHSLCQNLMWSSRLATNSTTLTRLAQAAAWHSAGFGCPQYRDSLHQHPQPLRPRCAAVPDCRRLHAARTTPAIQSVRPKTVTRRNVLKETVKVQSHSHSLSLSLSLPPSVSHFPSLSLHAPRLELQVFGKMPRMLRLLLHGSKHSHAW